MEMGTRIGTIFRESRESEKNGNVIVPVNLQK